MRYSMPGWLYALLPFLYVVGGLLVVFGVDNKVGLVAGLTLTNIGFLIIGLRRYIE